MSASGIMICDDLIFFSRVVSTARAAGLTVKQARTAAAAIEMAKQDCPGGVIVDLHNEGLDLPALLVSLREVCPVMPRVMGFGSHVAADLLRQAYVLVWRDRAAARRFLAAHPIARRWETLTVEHALALLLVAGHGSWSGRTILADLERGDAHGEVVVLTRARIRLGAWRAFRRARSSCRSQQATNSPIGSATAGDVAIPKRSAG